MSIQSEITRINTNIAGAYTAIGAKGVTLPEIQNSDNLAATIGNIPLAGTNVVAIHSDNNSTPEGGSLIIHSALSVLNASYIINHSPIQIQSIVSAFNNGQWIVLATPAYTMTYNGSDSSYIYYTSSVTFNYRIKKIAFPISISNNQHTDFQMSVYNSLTYSSANYAFLISA